MRSNHPQKIDTRNWYYENKGNIEVVHEVVKNGEHIQTDTFKIPWKRLLVSMTRRQP